MCDVTLILLKAPFNSNQPTGWIPSQQCQTTDGGPSQQCRTTDGGMMHRQLVIMLSFMPNVVLIGRLVVAVASIKGATPLPTGVQL